MVRILDFSADDRLRIERAVDEVWRRLRTANLPEPLRQQLLDVFDKQGKLRIISTGAVRGNSARPWPGLGGDVSRSG